ncbi:hypothetical protein PR202_ga15527 [Eleusine coracana subsp. coracana]|uniref:Uncharacterized protein n=1 Tax=Eleusine coracana subsp. coracana TaxID=191504 RepID=A0AAV5CKF2_ELECO|nr:hypothetical protein PR202_ga15527 [Eleusine coracana subsp. coracana]
MGALTRVASECGSGGFIKTREKEKEVDWIWKVMGGIKATDQDGHPYLGKMTPKSISQSAAGLAGNREKRNRAVPLLSPRSRHGAAAGAG